MLLQPPRRTYKITNNVMPLGGFFCVIMLLPISLMHIIIYSKLQLNNFIK